MKFLVTGAAGFIGFHVCQTLLKRGDEIVGIDNINDYYDISLKEARLERLAVESNFSFHKVDLTEKEKISSLFIEYSFDAVINLAAQAGVRYSITNPEAYIESNIVGFLNILEACRHNEIEHLVYASSSSVYGMNGSMPFSIHDNVDHPISLYAASKKSNELMAHTYSHLYNLPTTGLRFFTVYGPWGRPDMACFLFTKAITEGRPIQVFNNGEMRRDFTFIDDIVNGIIKVVDKPAQKNNSWNAMEPDPGTSSAPYRIYNIGNNTPVALKDFIAILEKEIGIEAIKEYLPLQDGDVVATFADIEDLRNDLGYQPLTNIASGLKQFVEWYKEFYRA
ncbi:NAD-dependent epimerase [Gammaproteobacteria bacterium]|nr:NAD-dependent epimerase [Gammaproteobacteria bacterium]